MFLIILHTSRLLITKNEGSSCDSNDEICAFEQSNALYSHMNGKKSKPMSMVMDLLIRIDSIHDRRSIHHMFVS